MNQHCPQENILSAFLDQALSPRRMDWVRNHLQACQACRGKLSDLTRQYRQMDEIIRNLPEVSASAGFDAAFWRKVAELKPKPSRPGWFESLFLNWRPLLAAGVAAGLVAGLVILRPNAPSPSSEEIFIADHMEMFSEYDLIQRLDLLENWETIETMKAEG